MKSKPQSRKKPRVGVIIAAGGKGRRMGGKTPKQFLPLAGRTVMEWTVAVFESIPDVSEIIIVAPGRHLGRVKRLVNRSDFRKVSAIVPGGRERQHSVRAGLLAFHSPPDIVLVHDAVRPLVDRLTVNRVIRAVKEEGAAVVGVKASETVKEEAPAGYYARTLDRRKLWIVQTPQGFRYDILKSAHQRAVKDGFVGTDDSSLVERMGVRVRIVGGSEGNIKITTRHHLLIASSLLIPRATGGGRGSSR